MDGSWKYISNLSLDERMEIFLTLFKDRRYLEYLEYIDKKGNSPYNSYLIELIKIGAVKEVKYNRESKYSLTSFGKALYRFLYEANEIANKKYGVDLSYLFRDDSLLIFDKIAKEREIVIRNDDEEEIARKLNEYGLVRIKIIRKKIVSNKYRINPEMLRRFYYKWAEYNEEFREEIKEKYKRIPWSVLEDLLDELKKLIEKGENIFDPNGLRRSLRYNSSLPRALRVLIGYGVISPIEEIDGKIKIEITRKGREFYIEVMEKIRSIIKDPQNLYLYYRAEDFLIKYFEKNGEKFI